MAESEAGLKQLKISKRPVLTFGKRPLISISNGQQRVFSLTKKEIIIFITLVSPTLSPSGEIIAKISFVFVSAALPAEVAVEEKAIK